MLETEGVTAENTGLSEDFLNRSTTQKDLINYMAVLEESMETKMKEMEEGIINFITRARNPTPLNLNIQLPSPIAQCTRTDYSPRPPT